MATGRIPTTANSPLTVKGDLFGYSTTQARVPVGNDGETLVADSSTTTGLRYTQNFAAGKNKIINGDFSIAQRGASRSLAFAFQYTLDRWCQNTDSGPTGTISQTAFTPGSAPVAGYEGQSYFNFNMTAITSGSFYVFAANRMEDVRTLAGQTATVSFWAKADATRSIAVKINQYFGSGGSSQVATVLAASQALTTSWVRYTYTVSIPSISGKTIGAGNFLEFELSLSSLVAQNINIWGVQVEAGSTATAFQTATGTIQGELAACQRYYWRSSGSAGQTPIGGYGTAYITTGVGFVITNPVPMRVAPTSLDFSNLQASDLNNAGLTMSAVALYVSTPMATSLTATVSGATQYRPYTILCNPSAGFIGVSAEL
jgi:hypothetical protein